MAGRQFAIHDSPGYIYTAGGQLVTETCPTCNILYAIPVEMQARALRYNSAAYPLRFAKVYCPNGHWWNYLGKTTEQLALEQAEHEIIVARRQRDAARDDLDAAKRQSSARKGQLTKMRNRYAAGICPVGSCHANLGDRVRDHIAHEHPEFRLADIAPDA